jgi:cholesterol oxidase
MATPPEARDTRRTMTRPALLAATGGAALDLSSIGRARPTIDGAEPHRNVAAVPLDMPLATAISELRPSYGVVVIGSGYGGAILAARLAASTSLCILERGREWVPGTFPDRMAAVTREFRTPQHPLGLYDYQANDEVDVLVGCGLGGTSLINANVVLAPADDVFDHPRWPAERRQDRDGGALEAYYALVRAVLQVERFPADQPPLRKSEALQQSTEARGVPFAMLDLVVNFTRVADQPNDVGVYQQLCTLCGDCVTGCNVRAKNTLAMHYLPLAKQQGAQIFTQIEVDHLVKWPDGGYVVHYTSYPSDGPPARSGVLHARVVIVAAGALRDARTLLLRQCRCPGASYNTDQQTDILGFSTVQDERAHIRVGPAVLSMADCREAPAGSAPLVI